MKRLILLLLMLATSAGASITFIQAAGNGSGGTSACATGGITNTGTCSNPFVPTLGNAVVGVQRTNASVTPYVQDSNFISLMQGAFVPAIAPGSQYTSFMGFATSGVTSYNFNEYGGSVSDLLAEYSGVGSFDLLPAVTSCSGTISPDNHSCTVTTVATSASMSFTLDESTDVGLCFVTQAVNNIAGAFTGASVGTVRLNYAASPTQIMIEASNVGTTASCTATIGSSTNFRLLPVILRPTLVSNTTGLIRQITTTGYVSATGPPLCTTTSTNCHGQFAPPLAGDPFVIDFSDHSDFSDVQRHVTSLCVCSVNTGCNSGNGYCNVSGVGTTLIYPGGNCTAYALDVETTPESNGQDTFYVASALGTEQYFDAVRDGANATNERQLYTVTEVVPASSPVATHGVFDGCPPPLLSTALSSTYAMPTTSFGGTNETLIEALTGGTPVMAFASPFLQGVMVPNHLIIGVATGQTAGTGPIVTATGPTGGAVGVVRQFRWVANATGSGNGAMGLFGVGH